MSKTVRKSPHTDNKHDRVYKPIPNQIKRNTIHSEQSQRDIKREVIPFGKYLDDLIKILEAHTKIIDDFNFINGIYNIEKHEYKIIMEVKR